MGFNATGARRFKRMSDLVSGVGFYIDWAGLRQASIAWPDGPPTRHTDTEFELGHYVDIGEVASAPTYQPPSNPEDDSRPLPTMGERLGQELDKISAVSEYIAANPESSNAQAVAHLETVGVTVDRTEVATVREMVESDNVERSDTLATEEAKAEVEQSEPSKLDEQNSPPGVDHSL